MSLLAFDIGGYSVKYGEWDKDLQKTGSFKTPDTWAEMKSEMLRVFKTFDNIQGIGLSMPGSFDAKKGSIKGTSPIAYIKNFNIMSELENMFDLPVTIENDANAAARAELWRGVAKNEKDVVFVVIGSYINGAIIADGHLQRGHNLSGGEFGNIILADNRTFDDLVSPVKIAERFSLLKNKKKDEYSGTDVFNLAKEGDKDAQAAVNDFYDHLSLALYNLQFTTDPSMIVLGGGISAEKDLIPELNKRIAERLKESSLETMDINLKACHFLHNANLVGAIASFSQQKGGDFWEIR